MAPPNVTYAVGSVVLAGNVAELPARYFAIFGHIYSLGLSGPTTMQWEQKWDDMAFDGTTVTILQVWYLNSLLPPPPALVKLAESGLQTLLLENYTVQSINQTFQNFSSLTYLGMTNVQISKLEQQAFAGLEQSLLILNFYFLSGSE